MDFLNIVKHSKGDEAKMWASVKHISETIEKLKEAHPELARKFKEEQYELMNGKHINEWLAKELVSKMWHKDSNSNDVMGEAVTPEEAMTLISDMTAEKQAKCKWDAYVGANAFMHDLSKTGFPKGEILKAAKMFWFHDEDMGEKCDKVYWYFKDWIFE